MTLIEKAIQLFNQGFSTMADKKRCLELVTRTYNECHKKISSSLLDKRNSGEMSNEVMEPLYYDFPYNLHQFRTKHSESYGILFPEEVKEIEYLVAFRNTINKAPVNTKKSAKEVFAEKVKELSTSNAIELAVMPLKVVAIERAEKEAKELIIRCTKILKDNGFDLNKVAPYPSYKLNRNDYDIASSRYKLFRMFTRTRPYRKMNEPEICVIDVNLIKKFIELSKEDASAQYDAFVAKLICKIGKVSEAKLTGNHVWSFSILTVTKADGTVENWKTQMIVNVSKLGKLFNQWPTRKVK